MNRRIEIVGIGAGAPGHLTLDAIDAIKRCDAFISADKGAAKHQLVAMREALVERWGAPTAEFVAIADPERGPDAARGSADYRAGVREWHAERTRRYVEAIEAMPADATVGFLVWGDPAFYDSTIRVVDGIRQHLDAEVNVTPGISAFQALAAAHQVVLHEVGQPIHITTGRRLVDEFSPDAGSFVVMLDGHLACRELVEKYPDERIYWGAQLGLSSQQLASGRLGDVMDEIVELRRLAREQDGWVMDVYALLP